MRYTGRGGLSRGLALRSLYLVLTVGTGCGAPPESPRGSVLHDSLGLAPDASVHTVDVIHVQGREFVEPDSIRVQPGEWVDFRSRDARPRVISFLLDSLTPPLRRYLVENGLEASPPLVRPGVHWVLPTDSAPPGRYPYRVEGTGDEGRGVLVVGSPPR